MNARTTHVCQPVEDYVLQIAEDQPITVAGSLLVEVPSDPTSGQTMGIIELSGALDFWDNPEEDIYSLDDGEPI